MFCVECGREGELIGSLCTECYSKKHIQASIPDHVDVTLCAHCSSMETDKGWKDVGSVREAAERAIEKAISLPKDAKLSELRVKLAERDERNVEAKVELSITAHGLQFVREISTIVRLKRGSCTECSKQQGNYYEAILQVRGPERSLPEDVMRDVQKLIRDRVAAMRRSSRDVFVSKVDEVKGGLDFYFGTIPAARTLARELQESFCAEFKESSSLWGRRDGKDIYRMTFLVRLPGFSRGDVVSTGGKDYYVRSMSRGVVHGIDMRTGEERPLKVKDQSAIVVSVPREKIVKAVVLMEKEREMQVLDPDTMAPVDVRKPEGFSRKGEQIRLAKTALGTYVLSDSW